jgi:formylglycine-generating enzyme required for sulfatase activity
VRGGSWLNYRDFMLVAYRYWYYPDYSFFNLGFRLVSPVF